MSAVSPPLSLRMKETVQPEPGRPPLALDRRPRDPELLGDLVEREAVEEVEVHDPRLPGVDLLETVERLVKGIDLEIALPSDPESLVESRLERSAPPLGGPFGLEIILEDPPHEHLGHGEELLPVLPLDVLLPQELREQLVDQSRGLESLGGPPAKEPAGDTAQVVEDLHHERLQGRGVAAAPGLEETGEVGHEDH